MSQENQKQYSNAPAHPLRIDRNQAITQLVALGNSRGDSRGDGVYIRAILPKEDPRYGPGTGRKADKLNWEQVERWQAEGYGIYIVVNGGGHKDKDITHCRAIFCEFDDRPIEDQINFWQDLRLPEPSLQIATRKSVHTYWVFNDPIPVAEWRKLQTTLLTYTGSDQSLKNPSRVMRLAGAYHIKPGCDPIRCDIIHQSDKRYSHEELGAAIPMVQQPMPPVLEPVPQLEERPQSSNAVPQYQRYEDIQIPVSASVPLEVCLSKESRTLLDSGVGEGGRNTNGAKLARDLIGTASHLRAIGQRFDGDPRQLLDDYASRCSPPLPVKEVDAIWKSAEKDQPGPSCKADGVEACIRGWYWNNHVKPNHRSQSSSNQPHRGFGNNNNGSGAPPPIVAVPLCERIREILSRYSLESLQVNALMELASATGRTYNELNQLARILRSEGDLADEVVEAVKSFRGILNSCRKRLDIRRYIDSTLSEPLLTKAAAQPTAPEYLFNTLLSSSASCLGTSAKVVINPEGGYTQPCIFWTANVAHSGQAKTPPQQVIVQPLEDMEAAAKELHDLQLEDYEQDKNSIAKPPIRIRRLLNNVTTSTKLRIHDENPRGLLEYLDELVADYQRLNQFKNGKGDDLQLELTFWNGGSANFDRHDARVFLKRTGFSKTGTYQWDTLARLMADDINFVASGYSARFLYCSIMDAPARYLDLLSNRAPDTLREKLSWLYQQLESLPAADYLLSHEAKVLFQGWNHTLVNAEIEEAHFGLSLVYAKVESYTARLALWLHIVNAVLRGEKPAPVISGETMQHATEIASFYLWQHKLIHAHNSPTRKLEGIFLKVQTQAEKFFAKSGKGVGASFLKTRVNALKSWVVEKIRSTVFKALAAAGHGQIQGEGAEMIYIPNTVPESMPPDRVGDVGGIGGELVVAPIAESTTATEIQTTVGGIGGMPHTGNGASYSASVLDDSLNHQFTNRGAEMIADAEVGPVGDTTNPSPIPPIASAAPAQQSTTAPELAAQIFLCQTWVQLAEVVGQNTDKLMVAANRITKQQRHGLKNLLATHLCSNPAELGQLAWVPEQLLERALSCLSFTIRRIGGAPNVLDACWESISGCKFVSVEYIGTRNERWVFQAKEGNRLAVFGVDAIEAITYGTPS